MRSKAVAAERRKRVSTGQMNRFLDKIDFQRAPVPMSKRIRIFYMTQAAVAPPTFVLFTDRDIKLHFAFERFLENQIREAFGFEGHTHLVQGEGAEREEGRVGHFMRGSIDRSSLCIVPHLQAMSAGNVGPPNESVSVRFPISPSIYASGR
jgi:hypothetical protein